MKKTILSIFVISALCVFAGCQQANDLKNDTVNSYENVKDKTLELKNNVENTVNNVNDTIESVKNTTESVSNAVNDLKDTQDKIDNLTGQ